MLYKYENGILNEYQVKIDKITLKQVREKIIENCSIIAHCKGVFANFLPQSTDNKSIRNIKKGSFHHTQDNKEWPDTDYYNYTYDTYYLPSIISIIDNILNDKEDQIDLLFTTDDIGYDLNNYRDVSIFKEINNLLNDYIKTNDEEKLSSAKARLNAFEHIDIQRQKKSIKEYYLELQKCFEFQKMNVYSQEDLNVLKNLFGDEWQIKVKEILNLANCTESSVKNTYVKRLMP